MVNREPSPSYQIDRILTAIRTLVATPFIPFIVLFCHSIEVGAEADLKLLQEFVDSLELVHGVSEAIGQIYTLARVLCKVTTLYNERKMREGSTQWLRLAGSEFDQYFGESGFMPSIFDYSMFDDRTTTP